HAAAGERIRLHHFVFHGRQFFRNLLRHQTFLLSHLLEIRQRLLGHHFARRRRKFRSHHAHCQSKKQDAAGDRPEFNANTRIRNGKCRRDALSDLAALYHGPQPNQFAPHFFCSQPDKVLSLTVPDARLAPTGSRRSLSHPPSYRASVALSNPQPYRASPALSRRNPVSPILLAAYSSFQACFQRRWLHSHISGRFRITDSRYLTYLRVNSPSGSSEASMQAISIVA